MGRRMRRSRRLWRDEIPHNSKTTVRIQESVHHMFRRLFLLSWRLIFWTVSQKETNAEKVYLQKKSVSERIF